MDLTHSPAFTDFQAGINEALAELDKLARYCSDTMAVDPDGALRTVEDLQGQIQEIADMIRGRMAIFKRAMRKAAACWPFVPQRLGLSEQCRA